MRNIRILLYIQFTELQIISSFKAASSGKKIAMILGLTLALIFFTSFLIPTSLLPALVFSNLGAPLKIPGLTLAMTSFVLFISATVRSHAIFSQKDWRILAPMPIPTWQIICSKLLFLYLLLFALNTGLMIPHILFLQTIFPHTFIALSIVPLIFITPLIPFVLGTSLTIGITALTRCFQKIDSRHVYTALGLITSLSITFFSHTLRPDTSIVAGSREAQIYIAGVIEHILKLYLPAWLLLPEYVPSLYVGVGLFICLSCLIFGSFVYFISKYYIRMNAYLTSKKTTIKKRQENKQYSTFMTLIHKEFKLISQFPTLLMGYTTSYVFFFILSGSLLITDLRTIFAFFHFDMQLDPAVLTSPFIYATMMAVIIQGLASYAAAAFSAEGKNIWLMQTLPLSFSSVFRAKLSVILILTLPTIPIFLTILLIKQQLSVLSFFLLTAWLIAYTMFTAISNLFINFKFPKYNWKSETEVIKQSTATVVSSFGHLLLLAALSIVGSLELLMPAEPFFILQIIAFVFISFLLFLLMNRQQLFVESQV